MKDEVLAALDAAAARVAASDAEADRLATEGHSEAAFVWAVRTVEIYLRDFLLVTAYIASGDTPDAASGRARKKAKAGWNALYGELEKHLGTVVPPMQMDDDSDAWAYWKSRVSNLRDGIAHGWPEAAVSRRNAQEAIQFGRQLRMQVGLRVTVTGGHPLSQRVRELFEYARDLNPPHLG